MFVDVELEPRGSAVGWESGSPSAEPFGGAGSLGASTDLGGGGLLSDFGGCPPCRVWLLGGPRQGPGLTRSAPLCLQAQQAHGGSL